MVMIWKMDNEGSKQAIAILYWRKIALCIAKYIRLSMLHRSYNWHATLFHHYCGASCLLNSVRHICRSGLPLQLSEATRRRSTVDGNVEP
jgi:hypothetical protein